MSRLELRAVPSQGAAGVAVHGALFVAGGAVFELFGDLAEVGDVVFGGHGDGALPEIAEGGVAVEDGGVLGVDVEEVELAGTGGELGFDAAEELSEEGGFEGVEEEGEGGSVGEREGEGVTVEEVDGGEEIGGEVRTVDVVLGDGGEAGVEFDAEDFKEGGLGGDEQGAAFAGADVEKGVAVDGEGRRGAVEPEVDEGAEDGGRDAVVGGDVLVAGVAGEELGAGDEAAGVGAVGGVEGLYGRALPGGELDELRLARRPGGRHGFQFR